MLSSGRLKTADCLACANEDIWEECGYLPDDKQLAAHFCLQGKAYEGPVVQSEVSKFKTKWVIFVAVINILNTTLREVNTALGLCPEAM